MTKWIPVATAARLARRGVSTIYRWIDDGYLLVKDDRDTGEIRVLATEVLQVEATRRRGRPPKSGKTGEVVSLLSDESARTDP